MFRPLGVIFRLNLGTYFTSFFQPEDDPQGSKHVVVVIITYIIIVVLTEISIISNKLNDFHKTGWILLVIYIYIRRSFATAV